MDNSREIQSQTPKSYNQQTSTPGSEIDISFVPRSSGSYTRSTILNCTNESNVNSSLIRLSSGACKRSTTVDIPSLARSSKSHTYNFQKNCSSTLESGANFLPRSSGSCTLSCTKSTKSSPGALCRICHDGELEEKLVSPCLCAGTQGLVHKTCLERWLSTASYENCELCRYPFHLRKKHKTFLEFLCHKWDPDMRRAVSGDLLCFLVLTPLTLISAYLCGRGAIQYFTYREYYDNRKKLSDQDVSIFPGPFSNRYRDRQLQRERIFKDSFGTTYVENENTYENVNRFEMPDEHEPLYMEALGLLVLALMLVVIYSCWLAIAVRYHVKAFRRWQRDHQDLVLVDVTNPGPICRLNLSYMSSDSPPNRVDYSQIFTLPEGSYIDLDEQRDQRLLLVPQVHDENERKGSLSQSNSSLVQNDRRHSIFSSRRASECLRRLSESGRKASVLVGRRASDGGRRSSIFSVNLRESTPTKCLMYEDLSEKALLDSSKNSSLKRYNAMNSLNISPKKYFEGKNIQNSGSKSPLQKYNGATWVGNEETKPPKTDANIKKNKVPSISPVAPEVSIPVYLEDYETPESYRIACAMYAEAIYNGEIAQMKRRPERYVGIHKFPFSPRFNHNRRGSTRSTHL